MLNKLIILFLCHFTIDMFSGIWPVYKSIGNLDLVRAGFIAMVGGVIGNMLQVVFGFYSDYGFRKIFILVGLLLVSAAAFYPYTQNYNILMVLVFATLVGSSAFHPSATGMVGMITRNKKGLAISSFISGGTVGFAVSQIIFREAYLVFNGQTLIITILPAIAFTLACFTKFENKQTIKYSISIKSEIAKLLNTCKGTIFLLYIIEVSLAAVIIAFIFILPEVMKAKDYAQNWCHGGAHMLFVAGAALIIIPAGHYSDKTSQKRVMLIALVSTLILYYIFLACPKMNLPIFIPMTISLGGAIGICNPVGVTLGNRLVPGQVSLVSALLMGFAWGGGSFSTLLVGYLSKTLGSPIAALHYMGIFVLIALILTLFLPGRQEVIEIESANIKKLL
ncbi:MAG: MFS transporter [Candidatus Anammoxibacter sp.]